VVFGRAAPGQELLPVLNYWKIRCCRDNLTSNKATLRIFPTPASHLGRFRYGAMKQVTLLDFIDFLEEQGPDDFKGTKVDRYLAKHQVDEEDFTPFIYFREESYGRNLVSRNACYELLVLTWLPEQRIPAHDYAGQRSWAHVQTGQLAVQVYQPLSKTNSSLVEARPAEIYGAGKPLYIDDGMGMLSISNSFKKPAVSVHLFAGPVTQCQMYDEETGSFQVVDLDYFTDANLLNPT
jgi:cysteine dioxygenase